MSKWYEDSPAVEDWWSESPVVGQATIDPAEEERQIKDISGMSENTGVSVSGINESYEEFRKPKAKRNIYAAAGMGGFDPGITEKNIPGRFIGETIQDSLDATNATLALGDAKINGQDIGQVYENWQKANQKAQVSGQIREAQSDPLTGLILKNVRVATPMIKSLWEAVPATAAGLGIGAGIGLAVGQIPPLTALPEELATVPAGAIKGAAAGLTASTATFWYRHGVGEFYGEMLQEGVDPKVAGIVAPIAAIPYAAIEFAQMKALSPTARMGLRQVINRSVTGVLAEAAKRHGTTVGVEVVEEMGQEIVKITGVEVAKYFSDLDVKFDLDSWTDRAMRVLDTGIEATKSMVLLPLPGTVVDIASGLPSTVPSGATSVKQVEQNYDKRIREAAPEKAEVLETLKKAEIEQLTGPEEAAKPPVKATETPAEPSKAVGAPITPEEGGDLGAIQAEAKSKGVTLDIAERKEGEDIKIALLQVDDPAQRGKGTGTDILRKVFAVADKHGLNVVGTPTGAFGDVHGDKIEAFLKKEGFVESSGKEGEFLVRTPEAPKAEEGGVKVFRGDIEEGRPLEAHVSSPPDVRGIFFSTEEDTARLFADMGRPPGEKGIVEKFKVNLKNPASEAIENEVLEKLGAKKDEDGLFVYTPDLANDVADELISRGYDGIIREDSDEIIAFSPESVTPQAKAKPRDILGGVDPIVQINKALTDAVAIRPKVEAERKVELRKRVGAAAGALKSSLTKRKISAEESIGKSTGLLKGPLSDAKFESIRDVMEESSPGAVDEAFRSIGESKKLKYFEIIETKEAFAKLIDGMPITLRQVDMIKRQFGIEMGEIAKQRAEKSTLSDKAFALWRAGLLTGLKTSGLNTMSNLTHAMTETAKDVIAAPVDIIASQFTGKREVGFTFKGIPTGIKEGVKKGWEYLKTGVSERDIGKKFDYVPVNFGNSKIGRAANVYVETIFHLMGAEDQPFFYGAMSRSIKSQSIAQGRNGGLKGQEFKDFVEKTRKAPTGEMLENATHDAEMAVFQNRTVLGDIARHIQKAPVVRWTVPFSRTPSAVAMQIVNYTPVGAFKEVFAQIHKGEFNQRNFSHAVGRAVVGTPALAIGAALVAKGLMTLDYPDGERERKLWELEGKKPFAIKIGDKWRSAFVLGPVGNVLMIGGYFQKALTESGSPSEAIVTAMSGGGKSFTEQTFVIGMSRAIDALKDPERSFDRFFTGMAGSFVPTILADVARATDYTERTYKGPWQGIVNRIPGARTTLEERLDVFGQDLPRYGGNPLEVMIDASRPVKIRQDVVVDELRRLWNEGVKVAPTKLGNRDGYDILTQEENTVLWRRAGEATYQSLFELIKKERAYLRKSDEKKGKLIEKEVKEAKDNARAEIAKIKLNQGVTMEELKESGLVTEDVEPLIRKRRR